MKLNLSKVFFCLVCLKCFSSSIMFSHENEKNSSDSLYSSNIYKVFVNHKKQFVWFAVPKAGYNSTKTIIA
jgi:hypothetical protein